MENVLETWTREGALDGRNQSPEADKALAWPIPGEQQLNSMRSSDGISGELGAH